MLGVPVPGHRDRRRRRGRGATTCARSAPAGSCTPSAPTRTPPGWPAFRVGRRIFTAFVVSGALAGAGRRALGGPVRHGRLHRRHRLRAAGRRRGRRRRRGDLRRQRHRRRGRASARCCCSTIQSALNVLGISSFWDQAIAGSCCSLAIALDRGITAAADRRAAQEELRVLEPERSRARRRTGTPAGPRLGTRRGCVRCPGRCRGAPAGRSALGHRPLVVVLVIAVFGVVRPRREFLTSGNLLQPRRSAPARSRSWRCRMTFIIITGEIDLSVASTLGLSSSAPRLSLEPRLADALAIVARSRRSGPRRRLQRAPRDPPRAARRWP